MNYLCVLVNCSKMPANSLHPTKTRRYKWIIRRILIVVFLICVIKIIVDKFVAPKSQENEQLIYDVSPSQKLEEYRATIEPLKSFIIRREREYNEKEKTEASTMVTEGNSVSMSPTTVGKKPVSQPAEREHLNVELARSRIELWGSAWSLKGLDFRQNPASEIVVHNTSAADVYLSLMNAGIIPDPYLNENDVALRWVANQSWTYETEFHIENVLSTLVLRGVDTVCSIYLNDQLVGKTDNMFRQYYFNISTASGKNRLKAVFSSAINYAKEKSDAFQKTYGYSVPPACPPSITNGVCHANFIRKMQASFSWDWGPAFPTMGFYRNLWIETTPSCFLDSLLGVPIFENNSWTLKSELFLYCHQSVEGTVVFSLPELTITENLDFKLEETKTGLNRLFKTIVVPSGVEVSPWWPNGYGAQKMYTLAAKVMFKSNGEQKTETKIAFRTVELVQEPVFSKFSGSAGLTFYFRVNSLPVFLKGTNWIPADSFQPRITIDKLKFLFKSMTAANMNAMRVWGGGVYESDEFYDLSDEHGILIWQDMMFACASYPGDAPFLKNVKFEVNDQIRRLKRHPSILLWAGNNENDGHKGLKQDRDYLNLYSETIWRAVNESDFFSRPFVLASPSNGLETIRKGGISNNPGDQRYGDVHFYNYGLNAWDHKTFPTPRCATEYGYQSLPQAETLKSGVQNVDDQWSYFSRSIRHRQHHMGGLTELIKIPLMHFAVPRCNVSSDRNRARNYYNVQSLKDVCEEPVERDPRKAEAQFLEDLIYLNQIHQARAYQTETEHYRRYRNRTDLNSGFGQTMCALYWQLNDIWQAPTWSTIDWGLRWKMAHYFAKKFFEPVLVSPYIDEQTFKIVVSSDLPDRLVDVKISFEIIPWKNNFKPTEISNISLSESIPAFSAKVVKEFTVSKLGRLAASFSNSNPLEPKDFVIRVQLVNDTQWISSENVLLPTDFHEISPKNFGNVRIKEVRKNVESKNFEIDLTATEIAPYVWLEISGTQGYFSDNGFTMTRSAKTVEFIPWNNSTNLEEFNKRLSVKTLRDLYPD